jgi:hypothetical protein
VVADKYATHDYDAEPYSQRYPLNHSEWPNYWGTMRRSVYKYGERCFVRIDGSGASEKDIGLLEADPGWDVRTTMYANDTDYEPDDDSDPEHDQTGPDWWSDPPEK